MELRTLRAFVEVVRQRGFSAAAKTLNATQPTISKAVKQIEVELGVALLDRIGHRSEMTAAGEIVYRRALAMLALGDNLLAELDELRGLKRGVLRLGLPPIGSSLLFAPLFAIYRGRYPGIDIRLIEQGSKRLEELLTTGEVELAAALLPISEDLDWQDVRSEPLMALLPAGHPCAGRDAVDQDLPRVCLVCAAHHLDERALARSILAEQDVDLARTKLEIHAIQCQHAGKALYDVSHFYDKRRGVRSAWHVVLPLG